MAEPRYFGAHLASLPAADNDSPVSIVGGGLAGMALALALHRQGVKARLHDIRPRGSARSDPRVIALSYGSQQIFSGLGVWPAIAPAATPIATIHVSQKGGFGRTCIRATEEGVPALGQVVPAGSIAAALDDALKKTGTEYRDGEKIGQVRVEGRQVCLTSGQGQHSYAPLVVYAEGGVSGEGDPVASGIKHRDYGQHALICTLTIDQPHANIARERFTPRGPLALLPLGKPDEYAVVYTCPPFEAARCLSLSEPEFLQTLQAHFGHRPRLTAVRDRHVFPLGLRYRVSPVGERCVWLGNAAQTLHPVAGQGFNLALRDAMALAQTLAGQADPGQPEVLARYAAARRIDRQGIIGLTDGLVRLFSNDLPVVREGRGLALLALDLLPPLRGFLARRMMYGARGF